MCFLTEAFIAPEVDSGHQYCEIYCPPPTYRCRPIEIGGIGGGVRGGRRNRRRRRRRRYIQAPNDIGLSGTARGRCRGRLFFRSGPLPHTSYRRHSPTGKRAMVMGREECSDSMGRGPSPSWASLVDTTLVPAFHSFTRSRSSLPSAQSPWLQQNDQRRCTVDGPLANQ